MSKSCKALTESDVDHFIRRGHVVLRDCFSRELAADWRALAFSRLGYDPDDAATWEEPRVHLPSMNRIPVREIAPGAWEAICDLLGGEDRLADPRTSWGDGFIINFSYGADEVWEPPETQREGWHKDGDFFRHFLDSPEQGLLTIVVWSDILPGSGGTFVACDSVKHVARHLYENPQGLLPSGSFGHLVSNCRDFAEITGNAGDVVLLHPFILHSASRNPSGRARFITNPPVALREPMDFNRDDPEDFSPVERAVLSGLGRERLDFKPSAPRERLVPERVRRQQEMLAAQKKRLAMG